MSDASTALHRREFFAEVRAASRIVICGHTNPDGDAHGSVLALVRVIRQLHPDKEVTGLLADDDPVTLPYQFMAGAHDLVSASLYEGEPDLFISVDVPKVERLLNAQPVFGRAKRTLAIDHHPDMQMFADVTIKAPTACACGLIIYHLLRDDALIDAKTALCLYTAICTDTGRFQYQNTNAECLHAAAKLVSLGAQPEVVSLHIFQSISAASLKLEARVLDRAKILAQGRAALTWYTHEDVEAFGALSYELEGLIDRLRSIRGTQVCALLKLRKDGVIKGSLRSKCCINVAELARSWNGGGHDKAAGFIFAPHEGESETAFLERVIATVERGISELVSDSNEVGCVCS